MPRHSYRSGRTSALLLVLLASIAQARASVVVTGTRVIYPGLASHPQHDLAMRQMGGVGGTMIAVDLGSKDAAFAAMNKMRIFQISNNLGDAKSIVTHPTTTTHQRLTEDVRAGLGITPGLLRLSIGIEHADDLIEDFRQAIA